MTFTRRRRCSTVLAIVLSLASCGGQSVDAEATDFWARPTPPGADSVAIYGTIANTSDVAGRLIDGYSPGCTTLEVHDVELSDDGVMQMRPAEPDRLDIDAGELLVLEPMNLHLMCIGLDDPLAEGDEFSLELTVEGVGVTETVVVVEDR